MAISTAITDIVEKFFIEKSIKIEVVVYGDMSYHLSDVIRGFMDSINARQYAVVHKYSQESSISIDSPLLVFIRNRKLLELFINAAKLNQNVKTDLKILVYLDGDINGLPSHQPFKYDSSGIMEHLYYIINERSLVVLLTMEYFNQHSCNKPEPGIIDVFYKGSMRWEAQLLDYDIHQNFFGCDLTLAEFFGPFMNFGNRNQDIIDCMSINNPICPQIMYQISQEEQPQGLTVELFKITSKIANFTPNFKIILPPETDRNFNVQDRHPLIKLTLGSLYKDFGHPTPFLMESNYILVITPNEFYTNYEKLFLPFDEATWLVLLLTFFLVFLVILLAKFLSKFIRNLIFGHEVLDPAFNVLQIFFGISQMKLPAASVPRYILMLFIVFCLIFRTCYQSMLFEFMTSDMRKPPPKTIEDLIDRDYRILTCDQGDLLELMEVLHGEKAWKQVKIFHECQQIYKIYCDTYDNSSSKLAFFFDENQFSTYSSMCHGSANKLKNFKSSTSLVTLHTTHSSLIYKHLSDILDKIIPAGIPQYLLVFYRSLLFKKYEPIMDKDPKVLTVDDLRFGFVLWLCACGISTIGFVLELMEFKMKKTIFDVFGFLGIFNVLQWRLRNV